MAKMEPPDLEGFVDLIRARSKNIVWEFQVEVEHWNYQLLCLAKTDVGGRDMQVSWAVSDNQIEDGKYGLPSLAEFIVLSVSRQFARALFVVEE